MYTAEMFIFVILMNELIVTAYIAKAFREERQELGKSGENVPGGRQNISRLLCSQEKNIAYLRWWWRLKCSFFACNRERRSKSNKRTVMYSSTLQMEDTILKKVGILKK